MGQQSVVHCGARRTNRKQGETVNMKEHSFILVCVMVPKRTKGLVQCPVLRIFISNEEFIRKGQGSLAWRRKGCCQKTIIRLMKKVDICQVQFQALYMIQQLILFFLQQPHDMDTCFIHNLQMRKLRNKEINYLPRVTQFMKLDFNSGSLASRLI